MSLFGRVTKGKLHLQRRLLSSSRAGSNVQVLGRTRQSGLLVSCEHAGNQLPVGVRWGDSDLERQLGEKHWAYDPGAREFAIELAEALDAPAVLSEFSRLWVDLNRPLASPTLARKVCDGVQVELNQNLDASTLTERIVKHYIPYHMELEKVACESNASRAISVHTYTDNYEGSKREFEIGVLFSTKCEDLAVRITQALVKNGFTARVNEPWSGKDGFMFSADCFMYNSSPSPGRRDALMFEFRNDMCVQPEWRKRVIQVVSPLLRLNK